MDAWSRLFLNLHDWENVGLVTRSRRSGGANHSVSTSPTVCCRLPPGPPKVLGYRAVPPGVRVTIRTDLDGRELAKPSCVRPRDRRTGLEMEIGKTVLGQTERLQDGPEMEMGRLQAVLISHTCDFDCNSRSALSWSILYFPWSTQEPTMNYRPSTHDHLL